MACGLTHAGITPVDIVKCRNQVSEPKMYPNMVKGIQMLAAQEGLSGLTLGLAPTLIGYSAQGMAKFGFYEMFKDVFKGIVGDDNAVKYKRIGWAVSSACAEIIADCALCPFEAVKVRIQTSQKGNFPTNFVGGFNQILANEGTNGLYKGLAPLWCRQVPYTVVKFVAFEAIVEQFYSKVLTAPKHEYSKGTQLGVTFASGYLAGVFCAIVSHPADTMVSKLNAIKSEGSTMDNVKKIYGDIGFNGLWKGLGTRIFMIGTLTGFQWWIYDSFKTAMGLQTTGGSAAPAKKQ